MHEVGIMRSALEIAITTANQSGARRITRLCLRVGAFAGVAPGALEFAFDAISAGTIAEGALLELVPVEVVCQCPRGCADFLPDGIVFRCPNCGNISFDIVRGRELEVVEVDVED